MQEEKKSQLIALLIELDMKELHNELNYHMDNKNKEDGLRVLNAINAVDTVIKYLES